MTLEEAQAEIIRLQEANTELTNERNTLSQNNESLTQEVNSLRTLNQKYFNKLSAQYSEPDGGKKDDDKTTPTCEEFAKTLNI